MFSDLEMDVAYLRDIGVEIVLEDPDAFLKIRETLQRMGIPSMKGGNQTLIQTAHILHKQGRYFIVHFKELFRLDGRPSTMTEEDILRRNAIAFLIDQWGLGSIVDRSQVEQRSHISSIKIVSHAERKSGKWNFVAKYRLGN